ncbi:MAG: mobile mystery protein A [Bacteroidota bacterium]
MTPFWAVQDSVPPGGGWIASIRTTLNMTLAQLGKKAGKTKQTISRLESSEADGTISLNVLRDTAQALDMQLVYAIIPKAGTLEEYIETKARALAQEIVSRTDQQMQLEAQGIDPRHREASVEQLTVDLIRSLDRKLWE